MTLLLARNAVAAFLVALTSPAYSASPHGDPKGCAACHLPAADASVGPARPSTETCVACHPTADMHPVGIRPATVKVAAGFPLENGLLSCITCHVEPAHGGAEALPAPYHRGGPYARTRDLCFQCHDASGYQRVNPHQAEDRACTACHEARPPAGALPDQARLRVDPKALCGGCHEGPVHSGVTAHLQATGPADAGLLLALDGSIQCWTCHNVHNHASPGPRAETPFVTALHGAARGGSWAGLPLDAQAKTPSPSPLLARPIQGDALCAACHGGGP